VHTIKQLKKQNYDSCNKLQNEFKLDANGRLFTTKKHIIIFTQTNVLGSS